MPDAYVSAATIRSRVPELNNVDAIPDEVITDAVAEFQDIVEEYLRTAFTPRTAVSETHHLDGDSWIRLKWQNVTSVTSISIAYLGSTTTITVSATDIDYAAGAINLRGTYSDTATVVYAHGLATADIPKILQRACRLYVRAVCLTDRTGTPRDTYVRTQGDVTDRLSTRDTTKGRCTGYIDVDRLIDSLPQAGHRPGVG